MLTPENLICLGSGYLFGFVTVGIIALIIQRRRARRRAELLKGSIFFPL